MEMALREAKASLSDLVAAASRGERVIITRHGQPAVELMPCKRCGGINFDRLEAARHRLDLEANEERWPSTFDDPALSRQVLGLNGK